MLYTKAEAQAEIARLVEDFKASEARLMSEPEAQIENNYVRPLFRCLNWNTENAGLAVADYEFVLQRTDRHGKRPDYVLQLDGQHLLVMDAKQVKYSMHDPRWMNQVYAYAYSTQNLSPTRKIDFAVLTDFQEFVVLDCTLYAATPSAVGNFRVLDWRYGDYVTQFDTLWDLFERENLRQAAQARGTGVPTGLWARCLSPKKVKANRVPPDKAFLAEMDDDHTGWRVRLAKDMKKRNPQADGPLLTAAVQLLIDRLIFVKVLSDREIEDDYLSQLAVTVERAGLAESDTGWFTACRAIFDRLNTFYNGSIFEPRPELEAVAVSNKVVRDILRSLQPENSPYNFAVLPVEILGTIYERFLGRVVRTTEKQVKIEDKPEVRKAGGVYYTPQYIVNYIVQNTVGRLLEECRTPEDVARLKILDPACGSGSFLLGAYQALIDWHVGYYGDKERLSKRDRSAAYEDSDGRVRLTARLKRQILLNNLYGVDIDAQAVEVTRLSLSLKALEDTRRDELYDERTLFNQTVLPDLSGNIQCGNSLIGPDYFAGQMFPDVSELRRVNPFDWDRALPEIMAAGGFDVVIGNPPYNAALTREMEGYLQRGYEGVRSGRQDSAAVFVEAGLRLSKTTVMYLLPYRLISRKRNHGPFQQWLYHNSQIQRILYLGKVREIGANDEFMIGQFAGAQTVGGSVMLVAARCSREEIETSEIPFLEIEQAKWGPPNYNMNVRVGLFDPVLLARIERCSIRLGEIAESRDGIVPFIRDRLVSSTRTDERYKPLLGIRGHYSLGRYSFSWGGTYICYDVNEARRYIKDKKELRKVQLRDESIFLQPEKILTAQDSTTIKGTLDSERFYTTNSIHTTYLKSPAAGYNIRYILGLMNSRLINYYHHSLVLKGQDLHPQILVTSLPRLPVRAIDFSDAADKARHDQMVQLVEAMLALHRYKAAAQTQAEHDLYQRQIDDTDRKIDELVYELYGLTADEIKIVEGG
jgi:hypothetical protein